MSSEQLKQKKSLAATEREENQRFFFILAFFSPYIFVLIHYLTSFTFPLNPPTALHLQNDCVQPGDEVHPRQNREG